jgi:hypothetical protein
MKKNILLWLMLIGLIGMQRAMDNDDGIVQPAAQGGINIGHLEQLAEQDLENRNLDTNSVRYKLLLDRKQKFYEEKQKRAKQAEGMHPYESRIKNKDSHFVEELQQLSLTDKAYVSLYKWALQYGNIEVIRFFIEKDKQYINSIDPKIKNTRTCPLIIANRHNQLDVIELLTKKYNAELDLYVNFVCKPKEKPIKN